MKILCVIWSCYSWHWGHETCRIRRIVRIHARTLLFNWFKNKCTVCQVIYLFSYYSYAFYSASSFYNDHLLQYVCVLQDLGDERGAVKDNTSMDYVKAPSPQFYVHTYCINRLYELSWYNHCMLSFDCLLVCLFVCTCLTQNQCRVYGSACVSQPAYSPADLHLVSGRCLWWPSFSVIWCMLKQRPYSLDL